MRRLLILVALLGCLPASVEAAAHTCSNGVYTATADITVGNSADSVSFVGTSGARCLVNMAGFKIKQANGDSTYNGTLTIQFADVYGCGTTFCITGGNVEYFYCNSCTIVIEDSNFHTGGGVFFHRVGNSTASFQRNRVWADNTLCVSHNAGNSCGLANNVPGWWHDRSTNTGLVTIAGNRFDESWIYSEGVNVQIGHSSGSLSACASGAANGNVLVGERAGIYVAGASSKVHCNVTFSKTDISPAEPYWADVENLVCIGGVVSYNVVVGGQWQTSGMGCDNHHNLFLDGAGHNSIRSRNGETSGTAHHLLFSGGTIAATSQRYGDDWNPTTGAYGGPESLLALYYSGNNPVFHHLTGDLGTRSYLSVLWAASSTTTTLRSSVFTNIYLQSGTCPGSSATQCSSVLGTSQNEGFITPLPARLLYADYNLYRFDTNSSRTTVYGFTVSGKSACDDDVGQHDIGTCNGNGSDPLFRGTLPISCGRLCHGTGLEGSGLPFNARELADRTYTAADVYTYYQWIYSPQSGSPLRSAADPTDSSDDIGAFAYDSGSAPAITTTNKRPRAWAGTSFTTGSTMYGSGTNEAHLLGFCNDDGLPSGTLTANWTQVNGPGTATIENSTYFSTRITTFSATGTYTMRLTCTDGSLTSRHDVQITKE